MQLSPQKTPKYWNDEVNKLRAEISGAQKALPDLSARKCSLFQEVCELERQKNQAKSSFDVLSELGRKVRQEQDKLAEAKRLRNKENNACSDQLETELSFCIAFLYKPTSEGISPLLDELSELFTCVKAEIASIDVNAIIKEKEEAEQQVVEIFRQLNEQKRKCRSSKSKQL